MSDKKELSYWFVKTLPYRFAILHWWRSSIFSKMYWWVVHRYHPRHQYNKLNTGLPPGYYDVDTQILYGVMNTFKEFYGTTNGHTHLNRNSDWDTHPDIINAEEFTKEWFDRYRDMKKELDEIYDWWVHKYLPFIEKMDSDEYNEIEVMAMFELEERMETEADQMLARLMKHRRSLWD